MIPQMLPKMISVDSREQALRDGTLLDVTQAAREVGIKYPVALTRAAWAACINLPAGLFRVEEALRLQEVIWMYRAAAASASGRLANFRVLVRQNSSERTKARVLLTALRGLGDHHEPVITIMMRWETYPLAQRMRLAS